jgi:hypothetical protein
MCVEMGSFGLVDLPEKGINHVESGMVLDSHREKAEDAIRRQRK